MSQRAASIKSTIKSAKAVKAPARKKSRSNNAAVELPAEIPKWMQTREEWQRLADSPAKRRAFIKKICRRIAEEFKPEKIILFGSYAYGKPGPDSDIDLLVVMPFEGGQSRRLWPASLISCLFVRLCGRSTRLEG